MTTPDHLTERLQAALDAICDPRLTVEPWAGRLGSKLRALRRRIERDQYPEDDPSLDTMVQELHDRELDFCLRAEARNETRRAVADGRLERPVADRLIEMLKRRNPKIGLDRPEEWVARMADGERRRITAPDRLLDPAKRAVLGRLLDELYRHETSVHARHLGAEAHEIDDIIQIAAIKIYRRVLSADRFDETAPIVEPGKVRAYVKEVISSAFIDLRGAVLPLEPGEPTPDSDPADPRSDDGPNEVEWNIDRTLAGRQAQQLSFAGPATLGRAFNEQWVRPTGAPRAKPTVARRFGVACFLVAEQRRQAELVIPWLPEAMARPIDHDNGLWLREPANRALCALEPDWAEAFTARPPESRNMPGIRGRTEKSNLRALDDLCGGRGDRKDRQEDPFGARSVRRHGITALLRLVYANLAVPTDGALT